MVRQAYDWKRSLLSGYTRPFSPGPMEPMLVCGGGGHSRDCWMARHGAVGDWVWSPSNTGLRWANQRGKRDKMAKCEDCGLPYEEHGSDITFSDEQWELIFPEVYGVLCGRCIAVRVHRLSGSVAIRAYIDFGNDLTGQ